MSSAASIRIDLDQAPEFYTNLDVVRGRIILSLTRSEQIGAVVVKLEGEAKSALVLSSSAHRIAQPRQSGPISLGENHKILYKIEQVFPRENRPSILQSVFLGPGQHEWPFELKIGLNNMCGNQSLMARLGGNAGAGGFGSASSAALGGIRVLDGSKQLMYQHVTQMLPPSFTGLPGLAEVRYYVKVTIQRPGLFKENWRYQRGLKFLPLEPPRAPPTNQEAYARRPFTFRERGPIRSASTCTGPKIAPSIGMSALLPHPSILTCLQPLPLRLMSKKLHPVPEDVFLIGLQIDLVGITRMRALDLVHEEAYRWVVQCRRGLSMLVSKASDPEGKETVLPDDLWRDMPLPNTITPSFLTCNLARSYELEVKVSLSWGAPPASRSQKQHKDDKNALCQEIHLPLRFNTIEVYSGVAPPPQLVEALCKAKTIGSSATRPPPLPARPNRQRPPSQQQQPATSDPALYPAQPRPGQNPEALQAAPPPYEDAPPSYNDAMAEMATGPAAERPAYSGQTNENGPSSVVVPENI